jgi:hypothetical protein
MAHVSRATSIMPRASIISPSNVQGGPRRGASALFSSLRLPCCANLCRAPCPIGSPFVALRVNRAANVRRDQELRSRRRDISTTRIAPRDHCLAGVVGLELRNPLGSKSAGVAARIFEELGATRHLPEPIQSRRYGLRFRGDRRTCSRQVRARIRRCRTGSWAE